MAARADAITHRRDMMKDGNTPLLYGYGGAISSATRPTAPRQAWLEMGGAFAEANLRGGG
jgi:prolyl oligopeptidase